MRRGKRAYEKAIKYFITLHNHNAQVKQFKPATEESSKVKMNFRNIIKPV